MLFILVLSILHDAVMLINFDVCMHAISDADFHDALHTPKIILHYAVTLVYVDACKSAIWDPCCRLS